MKKTLRLIIWCFAAIAMLLITVAVICFKLLDTQPYGETAFYKSELDAIEHIEDKAEHDTVEAGWSKVNLLPPFTTPIAIDAHRGGRHFEGVHDSIYVRAFVFKSGSKKIAYVSADLLIIPPLVTKMFDSLLINQGYTTQNIFFTATHAHSSIGAWHNSYVGEIFAGKFDPRIPAHIANCIAEAITEGRTKLRSS